MTRRTFLLCVTVLSVWPGALAAGQVVAGAPPAALRARLQNATFSVVTSVRGLPLTVREQLQTMWKTTTLDIAEPGEDFRRTGAGDPRLPLRRLVAAGCTSDNYCLVYYERGGSPATWHVTLFHWTPAEPRFEWGSTAPGGLTTVDEVRKGILSGVIKGDIGPW